MHVKEHLADDFVNRDLSYFNSAQPCKKRNTNCKLQGFFENQSVFFKKKFQITRL